MKKYLFTVLICIISFNIARSQWEFQYFDLKLGITHHALSKQPDSLNNFFLKTPDGQMRLSPSEKYFDYVPGINAGLHFHIDFQNDKGGFIIGAEYFNMGISSKYEFINEDYNIDYSLTSTKRIHGMGLPIYIKFGDEIFDRQMYGFAGMQYNINISLQTVEQVNWLTEKRSIWVKNNEFLKNNKVFFIGFNYMFFNIELDYMSANFLNPNHLVNVGSTDTPVNVSPYKVQPKSLLFMKTSINLPLSSWTTRKNHKLHRLIKRLF